MSSTRNIIGNESVVGTESATQFVGPLTGNASNVQIAGTTTNDIVTFSSGGNLQDSSVNIAS
jgi:hypothetical protein